MNPSHGVEMASAAAARAVEMKNEQFTQQQEPRPPFKQHGSLMSREEGDQQFFADESQPVRQHNRSSGSKGEGVQLQFATVPQPIHQQPPLSNFQFAERPLSECHRARQLPILLQSQAEQSRRQQCKKRQQLAPLPVGGEVVSDDVAARVSDRLAIAENHEDNHPNLTSKKDAAGVFEDPDISAEQLQLIKAKTMYEIVDDIDDGRRKVMFLTSLQAEVIASNTLYLQRMLDTFGVGGRPNLVINMLNSYGLGENIRMQGHACISESALRGNWAGIVYGKAPFESCEEEMAAEARLDEFMAEIIIPLAAKTNAIVLCSAIPGFCILTASFTRMLKLKSAAWGGKPPFVVLSTTGFVTDLYLNPNKNAHWRSIRRQSRTWKQLDTKLRKMSNNPGIMKKCQANHTEDLDDNATTFILVASVNKEETEYCPKPYARLMTELLRFLGSEIQTIAIKSGASHKLRLGDNRGASLGMAVDVVQSGTPLLCLDLRPRPQLGDYASSKRKALLEAAMASYKHDCEKLVENGIADSLDVCALAFFHAVLTGDEYSSSSRMGGMSRNSFMFGTTPLHEVIGQTRERSGPADFQLITEFANQFAHFHFSQAWDTIPVEARSEFHRGVYKEAIEIGNEHTAMTCETADQPLQTRSSYSDAWPSYSDAWRDLVYAMAVHARHLLASPNFYSVNLCDMDRVGRLVDELVLIDRLPAENSLEGSLLLRDAWCEYDVAMHLAGKYKIISKLLFCTQLLVVWLAICAVSVSQYPEFSHWSLSECVFGLSLIASFTASVEGMLMAKSRWRVLRSSAGKMHAIIWRYRARVGDFETIASRRSGKPEEILCELLKDWRNELIEMASLAATALSQKQKPSVYHHFQMEGQLASNDGDDFHSPIQPPRYISLRIEPSLAFYHQRIPRYARHNKYLKITLIVLGLIATMLAQQRQFPAVAIVTSAAVALTSWRESSDLTRKTERYTRAVTGLQNLLTWWSSLGEVEKASRKKISHLVCTAEAIISDEQLAWVSTAKHKKRQSDSDLTKDERGENAKANHTSYVWPEAKEMHRRLPSWRAQRV